ncbi:uncharacterized protein [Antedon mediterranea]|uniref:uncharacterized protein n=1 Tax=Antedon mediterranea TaxID=105859 RepID=UPI003AF4E5A8
MLLIRFKALHQICKHGRSLTRLSTNSLATSANSYCKNTPEDDEDPSRPLAYTKTKASTMRVSESFGAKHKRPLKKVLPICVLGIAALIWIFVREETEIDKKLSGEFYDHFPLVPGSTNSKEDEEEKTQKDTKAELS